MADEPAALRSVLRPADYVTLGNGLLGLAATVLAVLGRVEAAYVVVLVTVLTDGVDGAVARLGGGGGPLGGILDTLSDLVAFVVAPAVLVYAEFYDREVLPWLPLPDSLQPMLWTNAGVLIVVAAFFVAGLLRLARFEYLGGGGRDDLFHGLTTPGGAIVVVAVALLGRVHSDVEWLPAAALGLVLVAAALMVSRLEVPKLRGPLVLPSILVIGAAIAVGPRLSGLGPLLLLGFSLVYLAFGPAYVRARAREDPA
jgi:CDP-diacylglycerol--serine O-phosphatidyltransferase